MDEHEVNHNYEAEKKTNKKNISKGIKIVAILLAVAIVGGLGSGITLTTYLKHNSSVQDESMVNKISQDKTEVNTHASEESPSTNQETQTKNETDHEETTPVQVEEKELVVSRNTGDKSLSPSEVYSTYVSAVVAIRVNSSTTNIFGQTVSQAASGSGFIISEDGYIVTNYHVIESASSIVVMTYDEKEYSATVIGYEEDNDVALLKIDATGLTTVAIGDSDHIVVGEQVCAIGNPLGQLTFTLTCGYVSALNRVMNYDDTSINMFQTDVAINAGNSGGPLFDMNGNCIGITTAKYASSSLEGLGFVIPINDVMDIVNDVKQNGMSSGNAYLGVSVSDVKYASNYNLPDGAYVGYVYEGSAAEKAGVIVGDIITALGDNEVTSYSQLKKVLNKFEPGETTTITVFQSGLYKTFDITLDERPADSTENTTENNVAENSTNNNNQNGIYQSPYGWGYNFGSANGNDTMQDSGSGM